MTTGGTLKTCELYQVKGRSTTSGRSSSRRRFREPFETRSSFAIWTTVEYVLARIKEESHGFALKRLQGGAYRHFPEPDYLIVQSGVRELIKWIQGLTNLINFNKDADIGCAPKLDTRRFGGIFVATAETFHVAGYSCRPCPGSNFLPVVISGRRISCEVAVGIQL
jgi:hypothetical protein